MEKIKICFVGNLSLAFIKQDYEILKKYFDIELIKIPKTKLGWLKYLFSVSKQVKKNKIVFCWFAGWHSIFPVYYAKKYKKKSIIVTGGYDVAFIKEINYGTKILREKLPAKISFNICDLILPFSKNAEKEVFSLIKEKNKIKICYLGVAEERKKYSYKKENVAITVGNINWSNLKRKGLETFVKSAKYLPKIKFVVIGKFADSSIDYLKKIASSNVEFTGFISDEDLTIFYKNAKVYVQVSAHEGFGLALAEAMLYRNIPVVTNSGAIPEVVGKTGLYVRYDDEKSTAKSIKKAMELDYRFGKKAMERIKKKFPIKNRMKELKKIINELIEETK